jgi:hypothetical protein
MLKEGKKTTTKKKERVFLVWGVKIVCTLLRRREIVTQHAKKSRRDQSARPGHACF